MTTDVGRSRRSGDWVIMASYVIEGVINYAYAVLMVHLLAPTEFAAFSALSTLLLVVGTFAGASVPMVLAREVVNAPRRSAARRTAVTFSMAASAASSLVAAVVVVVLAARYASPALLALAAFSCVAVFCGSACAGYLQGERRFRLLTVTSLLDVVTKLVVGSALVLLLPRAESAFAGFAAGALLFGATGLWLMRHDFGRASLRGAADRALWRDALRLGAVQALVAACQAIDVIVLGVVAAGSFGFAEYQALLVLARVPLFVALALATTVYPALADRSATAAEQVGAIGRSLERALLLTGILAAGIVTAPDVFLHIALPDRYAGGTPLLLPLTLAAIGSGILALTATFFLAASRIAGMTVLLVALLAVTSCALVAAASSMPAVAWTMAATTLAGALVSLALVRRHWPGARMPVLPAAVLPVLLGALWVVRPYVAWWSVTGVVVIAAAVYWLEFVRGRRSGGANAGSSVRRSGRGPRRRPTR